MNTRELKENLESIIKTEVDKFEAETGFKINYIDVTKDNKVGFSFKEDTKISVKIKD